MNRNLKIILIALGLLTLLYFLWQIKLILLYILIAAILSLILKPLMRILQKIRIGKFSLPQTWNAIICLLVTLMITIGFVSIFVPLIIQESRILARIDLQEALEAFQEPLQQFEQWISRYLLAESDEKLHEKFEEKLATYLDLNHIPGLFNSFLAALGNIFVAGFSIFFICFFFLKEEKLLLKIIHTASPERYRNIINRILRNVINLLSRYFIGIMIQVIVITSLVTIGLTILGVENALVIGFFTGIINIIPYLGPIIGAIVGMIVAASSNLYLDFYTEMFPMLVKIACIFAIIQLLDNIIFQPLIFSNSVKAHPLEIFLMILISGSLAGITGMILAIPTYTFLRIVAKEFLSQFRIVRTLTKNI